MFLTQGRHVLSTTDGEEPLNEQLNNVYYKHDQKNWSPKFRRWKGSFFQLDLTILGHLQVGCHNNIYSFQLRSIHGKGNITSETKFRINSLNHHNYN